MKIEKDKVVAIDYALEVEGKIADKSAPDAPLEYIHGTGMLLPKFESELEGKEPGEDFEFTLTPEEGYGEYNPAYKVNIPKTAFQIDGVIREDLLTIGRVIPMYNSDGQIVQGTVAEVGKDSVTMDFNHPMAGKVLHFTGKVLSVRAATEKELTEGLHGEYLPKEEGCGGCGGGCHGGCHGGDGEEKEGGCCGGGEGHHKEGGCCGKGKNGGCCKDKE